MIIKHQKFLDVAFKLTRPLIHTHKQIIFRGTWLNMGYVETFELGIKATLKIDKSKLNEWLFCVDESLPCIRFSEWKSVGTLSFARSI